MKLNSADNKGTSSAIHRQTISIRSIFDTPPLNNAGGIPEIVQLKLQLLFLGRL